MNNIHELSMAIKQIFNMLGADLFSDSKKFNALLDDMAPGLIDERKIFHRGLTDKILEQISLIDSIVNGTFKHLK